MALAEMRKIGERTRALADRSHRRAASASCRSAKSSSRYRRASAPSSLPLPSIG
jgi:hypothetical protein